MNYSVLCVPRGGCLDLHYFHTTSLYPSRPAALQRREQLLRQWAYPICPSQVTFPHFAIAGTAPARKPLRRAGSRAKHGWQSGPGAAAAAHTSRNSAHTVRAQLVHPEPSAAVPIYFPETGPVLQHEQSDVSLIHTLSLAMIFGHVSD